MASEVEFESSEFPAALFLFLQTCGYSGNCEGC
jgi:hypothetical protein